MLKEIVQMSYLIIVADITLFIFILFNSTITGKRKAAFIIACAITFVMIASNIIIEICRGHNEFLPLMKLASAVSFSISGPVIIPFIYLTDVYGNRVKLAIRLLALFNMLLCFSSIYNGCIFRYDDEGYYDLGTLSIIPYFLSGVYLLILLSASFVKFRIGFRAESLFIFVLSLWVVTAVVMNTVYDFKFLVSGMAVLSSMFYYLFFSMQTLTRDALTNALNRHSFYKDIQNFKKHQMYIIAMDLNGLKQINDTLGHDEGDKAILTVAETAMSLIPMKCRFYRLGGDEFEILCPNMTKDEVERIIADLKMTIEERSYSIAAGYGEYTKGMDFDEVFRKVDAVMYEDKSRMKAVAKLKKQA